MSQDKDALSELDEAIEKARGLIPRGGSSRLEGKLRGYMKRTGKQPRVMDGSKSPAARATKRYDRSRVAADYLGERKPNWRRKGVYKSIDALDVEIEKALRINGGVRVSPATRRKIAMTRGHERNQRAGYSMHRGPHLGSGRKGSPGATAIGQNGRSGTYRRILGYKGHGKLKRMARENARAAIDRDHTRRGKASPFKRGMFGGLKRVKKSDDIHKAKPKTLYVYRPVENAEDILAHFRGQGFKSLLPAEKLHCTIMASAAELNWATLFDDHHIEPAEERKSMCDCGPVYRWEDRTKTKTIENGVREVKKLGDKGAVVLGFESLSLTQRWIDLRRAGAASKFSAFQPHITLTLTGDIPKDVQPYNGPIVLGEECWEEYKDGAYEGVEENVTKAAFDALNARLAAIETAASAPAKEAA